ncbi:hypothetical protein KUCAC02_015584, partial [Chaenocephalus aceratus]
GEDDAVSDELMIEWFNLDQEQAGGHAPGVRTGLHWEDAGPGGGAAQRGAGAAESDGET